MVEQARAADAPREPLARRSGTEGIGCMGCFDVHRIAGSQAVGCWQWRQLSWSRGVGCNERLWRKADGGGGRWIAHGDRGEAHVVFTEFFICSAVDFTVSRKVDMVPVASAVEGAHGSERVLLLRARMAVAALAMRRRALLGRRMRSWPGRYAWSWPRDAISSKRGGNSGFSAAVSAPEYSVP